MIAQLPDNELVQGCLRGERAAHEQLYARYSHRMMAICVRYAKDPTQAQDLLQDSFIRAFNNLKQFRFDGSLEGWLRQVVVRTAINHFRGAAAARPPDYSLESVVEFTSEDNHALSELSIQDIRSLINRLPDGCRLVMNLYCFEGHSHKEIAEMLGIEERTSSSQLFKARQKLLVLLRDSQYDLRYGSF